MHDCKGTDAKFHDIEELLYADDTLLIGRDVDATQEYMWKIAEEGRKYGMKLNWGKTEVMFINMCGQMHDPDGHPIKTTDNMKYLGAMLSTTGRCDVEITQRIGRAKYEFAVLQPNLEIFEELYSKKH